VSGNNELRNPSKWPKQAGFNLMELPKLIAIIIVSTGQLNED
jgi:hypothetical protein